MKKAVTTIGLISSLIVAGVIVLLVVVWATRAFGSQEAFVNNHLARWDVDVDRDTKVDGWDDSPCVVGEDIMEGTDGELYYRFSDTIETEDGVNHGCDPAYYATWFPDLPEGIVLEEKTSKATGKKACIYPHDVCNERRAEAYRQWEEDAKDRVTG